jgi:chloride channel protein, CIC family
LGADWGAVVFRLMISGVQTLFFSDLLPRVTVFAWKVNLGIILLPLMGALIIAPVVYHLAPETRGTGIPEIMDAYTEKQGRIRTRVAVLKIIVSAITIGSGGSGRVFAPTLYAGAMFGGVVGQVFASLTPGIATQSFGYSLSGMAALIAGSARAPLTSIIIVPEMTGDWNILPALMISCIISYYVSSYLLNRSSIYTLKLEKRGIDVKRLSVQDYLDLVSVGEVMEKLTPVVDDTSVAALISRKEEFGYPRLAVVHADSTMAGYVKFSDAEAVPPERRETTSVRAIANPDVVVVSAQESVREALKTMEERGLSELFVVDSAVTGRYVGMFGADSLVKARDLGIERSE